jgi:hypothetical protein
MKLILRTLACLVSALGMIIVFATPAHAATKEGFIRSFPDLPGFTEPTQQQIADLAQKQLDPNADSENNVGLLSGFTYFGQFLDHDLTLDTSAPPTAFVDPTTLVNSRTFSLDLDSVYGDGPTGSPELYEADHLHFRVQSPNPNGVLDLPRNPDGSAILVEHRNDENEILSQIHVTMLLAHNRLIDSGLSFTDARATLRSYYRQAVFGDFLPHVLTPPDPKMVKKMEPKKVGTPIEFSVAAYRFGHSQVRRAYELTDNTGKIQVFSATAPDLRGGRQLPGDRQIDWGNFFTEFTDPADVAHINTSRKVDTLISSSLFVLPIPGAEATGSNVLAFRNMSRAVFYNLPSGQSVAASLGYPVITPEQLNLGPGFSTGTPLWYYILAESERAGGRRLGQVGSCIVRAGFDSAAENAVKAETGIAKSVPAIPGADGMMTVSDLFAFAGVAR